MSSLV